MHAKSTGYVPAPHADLVKLASKSITMSNLKAMRMEIEDQHVAGLQNVIQKPRAQSLDSNFVRWSFKSGYKHDLPPTQF